ncbi:MAG: PTS fructose transporter subunit IIC [Erysipelotrichaceae bacterium]|nr:PTS fructose transporter subunit IIC [Erysipelotrichaceae bacterium]
MKDIKNQIQEALLTGVSYMLPFVISGGILIALGFLLGGYNIPNDVAQGANFASTIFWLGKVAFGLMVPVLGAYVSYSIADKPGIAPGMVGGFMAMDPWGLDMASGFLGGLIAGIVAGYIVNLLKKIPVPSSLRSLLPTLIIPVLGVTSVGLLMHYVIGGPIAAVTGALTNFLNNMGTGNLVILGIIQGCMLAFDMGGPFNKVAYAFALAAMDTGNFMPMAANFVGSMAPPLGIAIAILLDRNKEKFTDTDRNSLPGLFAGAAAMITEFAIPFAAAHPLQVIPSLMVGSAVGCALSYIFGLTMQAPHGGIFVLFALNNALLFLVALLVGGFVTGAILFFIKKPVSETEQSLEEIVD